MYSLLMMSAIATGGDAPAFNWGAGCYGSCSGVVATGCCGGYAVPTGCCGGYAVPTGCCGGTACYGGCCGGRPLLPLFPTLRARVSARLSCFGSACYGSSCHGSSCMGSSCYGSSCMGSSCYGSSCMGSSCYGSACYGSSCIGSISSGSGYAPAPVIGGGGCFGGPSLGVGFAGSQHHFPGVGGGCYGTGSGGAIYYGPDFHPSAIPSAVPMAAPTVTQSSNATMLRNDRDSNPMTEYQVSSAKPASAPARITLELPANATLYVDGEKVAGRGTTRNFHTPSLPAGTFFYDMKAEVKIDGEIESETIRVMIQAGDAKTESFDKLIAAVKSAKPSVVSK